MKEEIQKMRKEIQEVKQDLLVATSPEKTGGKAQDWIERIYQVAVNTGFDLQALSSIAWSGSPRKVADIVSRQAIMGKNKKEVLKDAIRKYSMQFK